jgi:cyanoexosortase B-associated protein
MKIKKIWDYRSVKLRKHLTFSRLVLIALLSMTIAIAAIPSYLSGKWNWADLPKVEQIQRLREIQKSGLTLPDTKTLEQQEIVIGGNQWSVQLLEKGDRLIELWLMPQDYYKNHPQVEWTDIKNFEGWNTANERTLTLIFEGQARVKAKLFKAWSNRTYAVLQWYAWEGGGNSSQMQWFFSDLWAQLQKHRKSWVAVSLKIPIEPLAELETQESSIASLAQTIQTTLEEKIFKPSDRTPQKTNKEIK